MPFRASILRQACAEPACAEPACPELVEGSKCSGQARASRSRLRAALNTKPLVAFSVLPEPVEGHFRTKRGTYEISSGDARLRAAERAPSRPRVRVPAA